MAQTPRVLQPYNSLQHFFGAELRRWRTLRGMSQDELGGLTHHSGDLIGKVEKAQRRPTVELAASCDQAMATNGVLGRLFQVIQASADAAAPTSASTTAAGGSYASLRRSPRACADTRGNTSVDRQLNRDSLPGVVRLAGAAWFGMLAAEYGAMPDPAGSPTEVPNRVERADVAALRHRTTDFERCDHQFGGALARAAMSGQLEWCCAVLRQSSMTGEIRDAWQSATARLADLLGWACFDGGQDRAARRFFLTAMQLAGEADDMQQRAHIAASMSRQLTYLGETTQALQILDLARVGHRDLPRLAWSVLHTVEARAFARRRDVQACLRAVGAGDEQFSASGAAGADDTWKYYADEGQLLGDAGHALFDLAIVTSGRRGRDLADTTRRRLEAAYATHPKSAARSKTLTMIRVAALAARSGDTASACDAAERALSDAAHVWSRRVDDDLQLLDTVLGQIYDERNQHDRIEAIHQLIRGREPRPVTIENPVQP